MRLRVRFYFCALIMLLAWHPCRADDALTAAEAKWAQTENGAEAAFNKHEKAQAKSWEEMRRRVLRKWTDGAMPEAKTFIEYSDQDTTRVKVDYENGTVTVEALIDSKDAESTVHAAKEKITKALASVISTDAKSTNAILSADEITATKEPLQDLVASLSKTPESSGGEKGDDGQERALYRVTFNLVPDYVKRRAEKYKPLVDVWAKKYNLDPAFILAIMRQESAFNPRARSWVGALGLMQIYPPYAGKEVFKTVMHKDAIPSDDFLYDPSNNVMMGATFLQILRDKYFVDIKDKEKQRYLITCGYNWSAGRLRKAIAKGRLLIKAPAPEVFDRLEQITPAETQGYLKRVTQFTKEFRGD